MRKLFVLLLFVFVSVNLFAFSFIDEFKDGKSFIPDRILLYTGNDKFN